MAKLVDDRAVNEDPMFSVITVTNRLRKDPEAKRNSLAEKGELFKNAPAVKGNFFKVASILE